jgi:hypothetical protein
VGGERQGTFLSCDFWLLSLSVCNITITLWQFSVGAHTSVTSKCQVLKETSVCCVSSVDPSLRPEDQTQNRTTHPPRGSSPDKGRIRDTRALTFFTTLLTLAMYSSSAGAAADAEPDWAASCGGGGEISFSGSVGVGKWNIVCVSL